MKYIYYIFFIPLLIAGAYSCKNTTDNPVDNPGNPVNNDKYGGYHILIDNIEVFPKLLSKDALIKKLQINVPPEARNGKLKFVFQDTVIYYRRNLKIIHIEEIKLTESGEQIQVNGFGFNHMENLIISLDSIQFKVDYVNDNLILLKSLAEKETINGLMVFKSDFFLCKVQVNLDLRIPPKFTGIRLSARNIFMTIYTQNSNSSGQDDYVNKRIDIDTKSENMGVEKIINEITFSKPQYPDYSIVKLNFESDNKLSYHDL